MKPLLRWWLFISLTLLLTFAFNYFGLFADLWDKDRTKLSFLIMGLFFLTSIHCGKETIKISKALEGDVAENEIKNTDWRGNQEIGWFIC